MSSWFLLESKILQLVRLLWWGQIWISARQRCMYHCKASRADWDSSVMNNVPHLERWGICWWLESLSIDLLLQETLRAFHFQPDQSNLASLHWPQMFSTAWLDSLWTKHCLHSYNIPAWCFWTRNSSFKPLLISAVRSSSIHWTVWFQPLAWCWSCILWSLQSE